MSEIANLSKTWILENLDSTVSTDHLDQKKWVFAIFQHNKYTKECWKIAKNQNHLAKFGCGNGAILVILFKKIGYFFLKKSKKIQNKKKKNVWKKILPLVPKLWYMFWKKVRNIFRNIFFNLFTNFCQFPEFHWDKYDGDVSGDSDGDGRFGVRNSPRLLPTYIRT